MKYQDTFEAETFYHVINHAVGSENLFRNDENFHYFLKKYEEYTHPVWDTYAYCLMPNHFHFLVRVKPLEALEKLPKFLGDVHKTVMQKWSNLLNAYAKAYNVMYDRKGALFLDFTRRIAVRDPAYFTTAVNYIHQNPVSHGFCKNTEDWVYSSYQACLSEKPSKIKRNELLEWFGSKEDLQKFHQENNAALNDDFEY